MSAPDVAVVIPTYGRSERLERLVRALEAQTLDPSRFEVVIVDDCSPDGALDVLHGLAAATTVDLQIVQTPQNGGPGPARNLGWRSTSAPVVAFTDDDCVPHPRWLEAGLATMAADDGLGLVQGCTLDAAGQPRASLWTLSRQITSPSPYFEGCNLFFRRAAIEETGGFAEQPHYRGEDTEAGWRVVSHGWGRAFDEGAVIYHDLEDRGLRYHLRMAYLEGTLVDIARRHPAFRAEGFWKPWAHRRRNASFLLALAGLVAARRSRWGLVLVMPWVYERRRAFVHRRGPELLAGWALEDAMACAGMLRAAARNRTLVV